MDNEDLTSKSEKLGRAITEAEAVLERLEREQAEARSRLASLRGQLASLHADSTVHLPVVPDTPKSPAEKVQLFRSLFRGREDVYPTRFMSKKTGKPGYAPACRNKFVAGLCELPRIKCVECTNQAFLPFNGAALLGHLTGRHVMGVYPMLEDETCWFLAVDFDKGSWAEDVKAFAQIARARGLPVAIERSRSGNGAHVWFFFTAPVVASVARQMGCHLLTESGGAFLWATF
jgi:hypothetical protein